MYCTVCANTVAADVSPLGFQSYCTCMKAAPVGPLAHSEVGQEEKDILRKLYSVIL